MSLTDLIFTKRSLCPGSLLHVKAFILRKKEIISTQYLKSSSWTDFVLNLNWTTWSPPNELINQFFEWEPLINIRYLALHLRALFPNFRFYYLFILILSIFIFSLLFSSIFYFLMLFSRKLDFELKFFLSIPFQKQSVFPSPNFKQESKAKWFRPILWGTSTPLLY